MAKRMFIERGGRRWEIVEAKPGGCPKLCAFRDGNDRNELDDYCATRCRLPRWFNKLNESGSYVLKDATRPAVNNAFESIIKYAADHCIATRCNGLGCGWCSIGS